MRSASPPVLMVKVYHAQVKWCRRSRRLTLTGFFISASIVVVSDRGVGGQRVLSGLFSNIMTGDEGDYVALTREIQTGSRQSKTNNKAKD